jgi:hypothetical protein
MNNRSTMGQRIAGVGGVALMASLFLPWAGEDGSTQSGWELWTTADVLFVFAGVFAVITAVAGGRIGVFRPDMSFAGATDLLGVVSTTLIAWMLIVDFPAGASIEEGAVAGLLGAMTVACGAADWSTLRGAPAFPRV